MVLHIENVSLDAEILKQPRDYTFSAEDVTFHSANWIFNLFFHVANFMTSMYSDVGTVKCLIASRA